MQTNHSKDSCALEKDPPDPKPHVSGYCTKCGCTKWLPDPGDGTGQPYVVRCANKSMQTNIFCNHLESEHVITIS